MNLIDKDDFNDALTILFEEGKELKRTAKTDKECRRCNDTLAGIVLAKQKLKEAPIITHTAPIGEWSEQMLFNDGFGGARVGYICSKCKKYVPFAGKFCGNCGASMKNGRSYDE